MFYIPVLTQFVHFFKLPKHNYSSKVIYSRVKYSTVQYSTVQYSTVQYSTLNVNNCIAQYITKYYSICPAA
jgi:hypothetical protein